MPQENNPQLPENQFSSQSRSGRNFGSLVQLLTHIEGGAATATNWNAVCQNLREKIHLLGVETDMKHELLQEERAARQHDHEWHVDLARNYMEISAENNQLKERIKELEDKLLASQEDCTRSRNNFWYRQWRCGQLWDELVKLDPNKNGYMPSLYEDFCEGPPPPQRDEATPSRKRKHEDSD